MADTLDILTPDEAKRAISMSTGAVQNDDVLATQITAVSRLVDDACGPVVQRTITSEYHHGGCRVIYLTQTPVASLTVVSEARGGLSTALTALTFGQEGDGFWAPPYRNDPSLLEGELHRGYGWAYPWCWGAVQVTYVAGRYADTESVDPKFKEAAGAILRRLWKRESGTWAQSAAFFDNNETQYASGFFQVAKPILKEMLRKELKPKGIA